jgi:hypothetical protein
MELFSTTASAISTLFTDQPYGKYFHGKVVDMFYFPFGTDFTKLVAYLGWK